ncbi:proliferation-associated protein 2G4 [Dimargaris cristalligena]|uniref:Proliferation-associated protein 2G4 n=1 Tax=Dimargaris cristalligena TaxID=215637 RepID=A0A4Q0A1K0_9FUNG|nr:proliferation-associated protein 2G4 [Dimargaris cristalligena]|eukprot:RKP39658.1 proliferation-associated protein 2G4 [Dimargaris cristalligena]
MSKLKKKVNATKEDASKHTIASPSVVNRFKSAARAADAAMEAVIAACLPGAKIPELCLLGDQAIQDALVKENISKTVAKGIAFPTTVSPNHIVAHLSPLQTSEEAGLELKAGDMVKIQLGAQVDGEPALVAHTLVVGQEKIDGRQADVLLAAHYATEATLKLLKPGKVNYDITEAIQKVASDFDAVPMEGMLSTQIQRNQIDGGKTIIVNPTPEQRKGHKTVEFQENEVYQLDIIVSTGDGKLRDTDYRTTVFKKTDSTYSLKMQTSQVVFREVQQKFAKFPFALRYLSDERKARLGLIECAKSGVVTPYTVYAEKTGALVAQFQMTVLILPTGAERITGSWFKPESVTSDKALKNQEIIDLLAA